MKNKYEWKKTQNLYILQLKYVLGKVIEEEKQKKEHSTNVVSFT
ncbi:hypothetical protein [Chryseobacterium sp. JV274]|nr:hypothetical protein [Chryseobacterium sp. JV274]